MLKIETYSCDLNYIEQPSNVCKQLRKTLRQIFTLLGFVIVEYLVTSTYYGFGIFLSDLVRNRNYSYYEGLWMIIIYISAANFAAPWSRHLSCRYLQFVSPNIIRAIVAVAAISLSQIWLISFIGNRLATILGFGIIGGTTSNLISTILLETIKVHHSLDTLAKLKQIVGLLSLLTAPHFLTFLINPRNTLEVNLIYSGILCGIAPAYMLIELNGHKLKKFRSLKNASFLTEEELLEETNSVSETERHYEMELNKLETEGEGNFLEDDDDFEYFENSSTNANFEKNEDSLVRRAYNLNKKPNTEYFDDKGVHILPIIFEENDDDINVINANRVSIISAKLEELNNVVELKSQSKSLTNLFDAVVAKRSNESVFEKFDTIDNHWQIPKNEAVQKFFREKLCCALKNPFFYFVLCNKTSNLLIATIFLTSIPYAIFSKLSADKNNVEVHEAPMMLSCIAFAGLFFLLAGSPFCFNLTRTKACFWIAFGSLILASSMAIIYTMKFANDGVILSSLIFGFGYSLNQFLEKRSYMILISNWRDIEGTLETLTGMLILAIYYFISLWEINRHLMVFIASVSYLVNSVLWIVTIHLKICRNSDSLKLMPTK